ncbi:hypothetical protein G9A89_001369 [Geosiphon pyriformis]|nr:hypothetical protein G9A89_001369 [Geosiphon pyriformis]
MSQLTESRRSARIAGEVAPPLEQPISVFCLVQGESKEKAFAVDIEKSKTVSHLREQIWEKRQHTFSNVDAPELTLWAVSVPIGDGTVQIDLTQVEKRKLLLRSKIVNVISEYELTNEGFYIVIEPPAAPTIIESRSLNTPKIQDIDLPSSASQPKKLRKIQADELVLCARPAECVGPPVHMYHKVFSKFPFDYNDENLEPSATLCRWTIKFIRSMTDIYGDEDGRQAALHDFVCRLTNDSTTDRFCDGMIECQTAIGKGTYCQH